MLTNQTRYKTVCIIYVHKIKLVYKCKIINSSVELLIKIINSSVELLSHVQLFVTPWTSACQVSLSITNSQREPTQTHVHCVSNAIQTSHSLSSHSPAFNLVQHQGLSLMSQGNESVLCIRWPVLEFQLQHLSFQ